MNRINQCFLEICVLFTLLTGCASNRDPIHKWLDDNYFEPVVPIPSIQHVGDIYRSKDLTTPVLLMRDVFSKEENEHRMRKIQGEVVIKKTSGESSYDIEANPDFVDYVKTELKKNNVKKYKVEGGPFYQYIISEDNFNRIFWPRVKERRDVNDINLDKTYILLALLEASALEYTFFDDSSSKIDVMPGSKIEQLFREKLGVNWKTNENNNISFSSPHFIGCRFGIWEKESCKAQFGDRWIWGPNFSTVGVIGAVLIFVAISSGG